MVVLYSNIYEVRFRKIIHAYYTCALEAYGLLVLVIHAACMQSG